MSSTNYPTAFVLIGPRLTGPMALVGRLTKRRRAPLFGNIAVESAIRVQAGLGWPHEKCAVGGNSVRVIDRTGQRYGSIGRGVRRGAVAIVLVVLLLASRALRVAFSPSFERLGQQVSVDADRQSRVRPGIPKRFPCRNPFPGNC
ncbi:hypothetical protein BJX65DRAFT_112822 [Aspergillus insuetus]